MDDVDRAPPGGLPSRRNLTMIIGLLLLAWTGARAAPAAEDPGAPPTATEPPPVSAPDDPCRAAPPDRNAPFDQELSRAIDLYRRGCHEWALDLLRDLDVRRQLAAEPPARASDQRKYLGEVQLVLGRRQEAEDTFRLLLAEQPEAEMSLLVHAPEAVNLFTRIKADLTPRPPGPDPSLTDIPRRPLYTYVPFGTAHFAAGDTRRGLGYGAVQGAFYGVAVATFVLLPRGPAGSRNADTVRRDRTLRAINFAANTGFVVTYTLSQLDARRRWRARYGVSVGLGPSGVSLRIVGRAPAPPSPR